MATADMTGHRPAPDPRLHNADLAPTPVAARQWTTWNYAALWMGMVHSAFGFAVLGTMIATGMSAWQALTAVFVANLVQLGLMSLTGRIGARHGIPFAVWARVACGIRGAYAVAALRAIVAIGWFGVQSYLGATALNALLGAVSGTWHNWNAQVGGVAANLWVAMLIYWAINFLAIRHGMQTIRRLESWAGPLVFVVMIPMLIWALRSGHGLGPVFETRGKYASTGGFLLHGLLPGVAFFISASWATMILNLPDLTRFARSNRAQVSGMFWGLPIATAVFYGMSAIIVSGAQAATGKPLWNPADVLIAIGNPVFTVVGAVLITVATLSVNVAANLVSPGYDLSAILPRLLTFRRAAAVSIVLGFVYMPWRLMAAPNILFGVLNNIGAILGPTTGVLIADYYLSRRQRIDKDALYRREGRYWGVAGFNPWALSVLAAGSAFCLLGQVIPAISWAFDYAALLGIALGFVAYTLLLPLVRRGGRCAELAAPAGDKGTYASELSTTPAPVHAAHARRADEAIEEV